MCWKPVKAATRFLNDAQICINNGQLAEAEALLETAEKAAGSHSRTIVDGISVGLRIYQLRTSLKKASTAVTQQSASSFDSLFNS